MMSLIPALFCIVLSGAASQIEYADDFAGLPNGDAAVANWEAMTPTWKIEDHAFVQTDTTFYGTYAFLKDRVFSDFTMSVKFQIAAEGAGGRCSGLAFRSRNGSEGYYIHFDPTWGQVIFQVMEPGKHGRETSAKRVARQIAIGQWHEAKVEAAGSHFRFSLDGNLLFEVDDATYPAGRVGLRAGQGKIRFKDFSIKGAQGTLAKPWTMQPVPRNIQTACEPFHTLRKAERVIVAKGEGFFPVMLKLQDGSLGAVIRGGAGHVGLGGRLDFIRSNDGGRTWSKPVVAIDSQWDDRNPAFGQMPDGTLVLAYGEAHSYRPDGAFDLTAGPYLSFLVTSSDSGRTWSQKRAFSTPWPNASPYGKITVCKDGTALMNIYQMPSNAMGILRSKDNGKTWGDFSPIPGAHDETQVIELPEGPLMAFTRTEGNPNDAGLLLSESDDKGYTWVRSRKLLRPDQWPFDATVLKSGHLLLSYGSRVGPGQFGAGVILSDDLGKSWDEDDSVLLGWDSLNVDTGYPSTAQLDDGTIVTMYYAGGTTASPSVQAIVVRYTEEQVAEAASR